MAKMEKWQEEENKPEPAIELSYEEPEEKPSLRKRLSRFFSPEKQEQPSPEPEPTEQYENQSEPALEIGEPEPRPQPKIEIVHPSVEAAPQIEEPYINTVYRGISLTGPTDEGMYGKGTYFTANKEYATNYAKLPPSIELKPQEGEIIERQVKLNKPLIITHKNSSVLDNIRTESMLQTQGMLYKERLELASQAIRNKIEAQGYDGIVLRWSGAGKVDEVVVFYPEASIQKLPIAKQQSMPPYSLQIPVTPQPPPSPVSHPAAPQIETKIPFEEAPNLPIGYVQAKRQIGGTYKLFYRGTRNEVFPGQIFNSASEARNYFKAMSLKSQQVESQPTPSIPQPVIETTFPETSLLGPAPISQPTAPSYRAGSSLPAYTEPEAPPQSMYDIALARNQETTSKATELRATFEAQQAAIKETLPITPIEEIPYNRELDIRNTEALPKGTGANYLVVIKGQGSEFIAKKWARVKPKKLKTGEVLINMIPAPEPAAPTSISTPEAGGPFSKFVRDLGDQLTPEDNYLTRQTSLGETAILKPEAKTKALTIAMNAYDSKVINLNELANALDDILPEHGFNSDRDLLEFVDYYHGKFKPGATRTETPMTEQELNDYFSTKPTGSLSIYPEPIEKIEATSYAPPGKRWAGDRGAMPGEPAYFLDGDEETGKAAITEIIDDRGNVLYKATDAQGNIIGIFQTIGQAASAAESQFPELQPKPAPQQFEVIGGLTIPVEQPKIRYVRTRTTKRKPRKPPLPSSSSSW